MLGYFCLYALLDFSNFASSFPENDEGTGKC